MSFYTNVERINRKNKNKEDGQASRMKNVIK